MARHTRHYSSREALETRIDYVEGKLDAAILDLKEAIQQSEARLKADREESATRLAADREESAARLKADREDFQQRFAEERKEWRSTKRWLYLNFGGVIALIITVLLAIMNGNIPN